MTITIDSRLDDSADAIGWRKQGHGWTVAPDERHPALRVVRVQRRTRSETHRALRALVREGRRWGLVFVWGGTSHAPFVTVRENPRAPWPALAAMGLPSWGAIHRGLREMQKVMNRFVRCLEDALRNWLAYMREQFHAFGEAMMRAIADGLAVPSEMPAVPIVPEP